MARFYAKDGQFWLDDAAQFIHAGEFHYFRTPAEAWAHRLSLLLEAGFNTVACYIPWLWHQPEADLIDLTGQSHPLRDLAGFLDLAAEMGLMIIARPGPYIMAETINEGVPPWVFEQHPQAAFISQDGRTQNIASYLHPEFLACAERWYEAVFAVLAPRQITRGGRIIMVQLDNEMGMIQWVRNIFDINPHTLERFAAYLRGTYGAALDARYPAASLPDLLREQIMQPQPLPGAAVVEDYRRFYRSYLGEYAAFLLRAAKEQGLEVPPVINIHGFANGGKTYPIGLSQLVEALELDEVISATDVYPIFIGEGNFHQLLLVNEMTKALQNSEQALFSIEFQAGGNQDFSGAQSSLYDLHSRLCISVGMRAINHYLFYDGENHPLLSPVKRHNWGHPVRKDGTLRRHYARYPKLSRVLAAYGPALIHARPRTVTTIGFLLDNYMTEVNNPVTRSATDILTHQRDVILFDFLARGLALTQRPFDALELKRANLNARQTPLLWVMMEQNCDEDVQRKLVAYLEEGGQLVLVGRMCEADSQQRPCTILREALGISGSQRSAPFSQTLIRAFAQEDVPVSFMETYAGNFDEVFARAADGEVVGFIQRVGRGRAMVLGAAFPANTLEDLSILELMAEKMGCVPLFTLTDWGDVRLSAGEAGQFLFINNYQDDAIETAVSMAGQPLFGGQALTLPARQGLILPLDWEVSAGVTIHWLTAEVSEVSDEGQRLIIRTAQPKCHAELSLRGYRCDPAQLVGQVGERVRLAVHDGLIELAKG